MVPEFIYEIDQFGLENEIAYQKWLLKIIGSENRICGEVKYIFVDEEAILKINSDFLKHNYLTDIITFDNSFLNTVSGEIYISVPTVESNSRIFSRNKFKLELDRVIVHGLLHLIGYKDKSDEEASLMRKKENQYLKFLD